VGAKFHFREGDSPDYMLRSLIIFKCQQSDILPKRLGGRLRSGHPIMIA